MCAHSGVVIGSGTGTSHIIVRLSHTPWLSHTHFKSIVPVCSSWCFMFPTAIACCACHNNTFSIGVFQVVIQCCDSHRYTLVSDKSPRIQLLRGECATCAFGIVDACLQIYSIRKCFVECPLTDHGGTAHCA